MARVAKTLTEEELRGRRRMGVMITTVRNALGISQRELGRRTDSSGATIAALERGDQDVGSDLLFRIARELRIPMATLEQVRYGDEGESTPEQLISRMMLRMDPNKRRALLVFARTLLGEDEQAAS